MRTIKDSDTRKQEILNSAIRVFAKKGYDKSSISDIAKEAGISQGLCYRYFSSKEDIYDAAIDLYADYIVEQNKAHYQQISQSLKEQIKMKAGNINHYSDSEQQMTELYALFHQKGNEKLHNQLFLKVSQKLVPYIAEVLTEAKKHGEIQISDIEATAYFFVFGQMGMLMDGKDQPERIQNCLMELLQL